MPNCPQCDEPVDDGFAYCPTCGAAVEETGDDAEADVNPAHADEPETPTESAPAQTPDHGDASRPEPQAVDDDADDGIGRREAIMGGAALGVAGLVYFAFIRDDEPSTPLAVHERLMDAWASNDDDRYRSLTHSDSPLRDTARWDDEAYWEDFGQQPGEEVDPVEQTVIEETDDIAVVEDRYAWESPDADGCLTEEWEYRKEDGQWRFWDVELVEQEPYDACH